MRMKEIKLFVLKKKNKLIFEPSSFDAKGVDSWLRQDCSFLNSGGRGEILKCVSFVHPRKEARPLHVHTDRF